MPRSLNFDYRGKSFGLELVKVDRSKLYGDVSLESYDDEGKLCELVTLARDGKTIIAGGGTASGYLSEDGTWVDRDELSATNAEGEVLAVVPASFDLVTPLSREVPVEEYLDHAIRLTYLLNPPPDTLEPDFAEALKGGTIFRIDFSYRGGSFADPAFILGGGDDTIWLMIAEPSQVTYVGLSQAAVCAANATAETESDDADDDFNFDMM
jgi:hypothetical protein